MLVIHDVNNALRAFFDTELYTYNVPLESTFLFYKLPFGEEFGKGILQLQLMKNKDL